MDDALLSIRPGGTGNPDRSNIMRYAQTTLDKIATAEKNGATIHENTNWRFNGRGIGFSRVEKLAQTNDRRHGHPKRIVWACYK